MRTLLLVVGGVFVAAIVGTIGWFGIDEATARNEVAPNVDYDGTSMRRAPIDDVPSIVRRRADQILSTAIVIETPGAPIETTAGELGVEVDEEATVEALLQAGRTGGFFERLWSWARAPWKPRTVETVVEWTEERIAAGLADHDGVIITSAEEPRVEVTSEAVEVIPGVAGVRVDVAATAAVVDGRIVPGDPVEIGAKLITTAPTDSDETARALADRLRDITDQGLTVRVLGAVGRLSDETLRDAIEVTGPVSEPEISFERDLLQAALLDLFATLTRAGSDPVFDIEDGDPVLVEEGSLPRGCCAPEAGRVIVEALESDATEPVDIPDTPVGAPALEAWAGGEGVAEVVGEFTTEHSCCEARVANIHRIADLTRGQYLLPGESFSINEFVGERTVEKGFVGAGVIEHGRFTDSVGGGISQFATTFFNAAFFAGLDIDEYQSHSIYISRYPYGREATLSYPQPDLVITNSTEYPILIWPTYTDTTITVSIYSTPHIEVEETGQEERPARSCTQVETYRSRTYPDGRVVEDSFLALYRPAEGLDCDGNPTPER